MVGFLGELAMANSPAPALRLFDGDEGRLRGLVRSTTVRAGDAKRARIVLLASEGVANTRIAELTGASVVTVLKWRARYEDLGIAGLGDADRSGRPRLLDHAAIVAATLTAPPKKYGVTHWSSRLLASHLKIG
ncbi:helix-turn-helix domain-containing protein, partial [Micrococcales bacterium 31B]|nr:helix-turn-helix domain-containing protein [Micrococcales bacterium 31B]